MKVIEQTCIKDWEITAQNGDYFKAEKGKSYTTTVPKNGSVVVFSNYWVRVPKECFVVDRRKN